MRRTIYLLVWERLPRLVTRIGVIGKNARAPRKPYISRRQQLIVDTVQLASISP